MRLLSALPFLCSLEKHQLGEPSLTYAFFLNHEMVYPLHLQSDFTIGHCFTCACRKFLVAETAVCFVYKENASSFGSNAEREKEKD